MVDVGVSLNAAESPTTMGHCGEEVDVTRMADRGCDDQLDEEAEAGSDATNFPELTSIGQSRA